MAASGESLRRRLRVMVVTHPRPATGRPLPEVVAACLAGGATAVELRDKEASGRRLWEQARRLLGPVREHGALLVVNDRADVALAAGADGVHLGPEDVPVAAVRRFAPDGFLIGYSTDRPEEARAAADAGASYLGVGAVFGTGSKEGLEEEAIGPERVREVLSAAGLPGVGIGGITPRNAAAVARAGAGVAVLSAAVHADDPEAAVRALREAVDRSWEGRPAAGPGEG